MFNKFKSKKEEARYEKVYHGTDEELYEEDLDKVVAGVNISRIEKSIDNDELSVEELDRVTAGVPPIPNIDVELEKGTYIDDNGEIVREERSR